MATVEEIQKSHEAAVNTLIGQRAGQGKDSDLALARALIHRAVHLVADRKAAEFCAVATYLAEMTQHSHALLHGGNEAPAERHRDVH